MSEGDSLRTIGVKFEVQADELRDALTSLDDSVKGTIENLRTLDEESTDILQRLANRLSAQFTGGFGPPPAGDPSTITQAAPLQPKDPAPQTGQDPTQGRQGVPLSDDCCKSLIALLTPIQKDIDRISRILDPWLPSVQQTLERMQGNTGQLPLIASSFQRMEQSLSDLSDSVTGLVTTAVQGQPPAAAGAGAGGGVGAGAPAAMPMTLAAGTPQVTEFEERLRSVFGGVGQRRARGLLGDLQGMINLLRSESRTQGINLGQALRADVEERGGMIRAAPRVGAAGATDIESDIRRLINGLNRTFGQIVRYVGTQTGRETPLAPGQSMQIQELTTRTGEEGAVAFATRQGRSRAAAGRFTERSGEVDINFFTQQIVSVITELIRGAISRLGNEAVREALGRMEININADVSTEELPTTVGLRIREIITG